MSTTLGKLFDNIIKATGKMPDEIELVGVHEETYVDLSGQFTILYDGTKTVVCPGKSIASVRVLHHEPTLRLSAIDDGKPVALDREGAIKLREALDHFIGGEPEPELRVGSTVRIIGPSISGLRGNIGLYANVIRLNELGHCNVDVANIDKGHIFPTSHVEVIG